ncbi:hypothetical protein Vadar_010402 [Vaccinium darrowii]|uniref:Uncharacterized protein n=1 Tax=Vaccinium darrowii TaxID=229202 RepID=A0ACB7YUS1_9ERIC|nr:hypothetical protein Vadar_010402 [Vaccinium darrowii]
MPRFFSFIPVVSLFFALPLKLHSVQLGGNTAFFIAWLSNFKLLLLAFSEGPLSDPSLSPLRFIAVACFPIRIETTQDGQNPPPKLENSPKSQKDGHNSQNPPPNGQNRENPGLETNEEGNKSVWNYAVKIVLLALFIRIYEYSDRMHPKVILVIYCFHIYFSLEIALATAAAMVRALFGLELEPQFNDPYLSTSLQDVWGRRWNLVVSRTLRPTVYEPVLRVTARFLGRK